MATATAADQYASELKDLGHGIFTYAILQGSQGKADTYPKDGIVMIKELFKFLKKNVPSLANKYQTGDQTPMFSSQGNDFELVKK